MTTESDESNRSPSSPMASPDDTHGFCVALPTGTEGPYTRPELRSMLSVGRIKPDDRVMEEGHSMSVLTIIDLIPEARELSANAERVRRRTTSGEHRVQRAGSSSEVRRYRNATSTVPPSSGPVSSVISESGFGQSIRRISPAWLIPLALLVASLLVAQVASSGMFGAPRVRPLISKWRVQTFGAFGGPWTFTINEGSLITEGPNGQTITCTADVQMEDDFHTIITLSPPHPVLGAHITLVATLEMIIPGQTTKGVGQPMTDL